MKVLIYILLFLLTTFSIVNAQSSVDVFLIPANKAYDEGNYALAIEQYERILETDTVGTNLYYNLGTSYLNNNEISEAILYLERALKENPRHGAAIHNLKVAQQKMQHYIEDPSNFFVQFCVSIVNIMSTTVWLI